MRADSTTAKVVEFDIYFRETSVEAIIADFLDRMAIGAIYDGEILGKICKTPTDRS